MDRIRQPFGITGRTGPGMRQVVGLGIGPREGVLLEANFGRAIVTNGDFTAYVSDSAATRPSSQITLGRLVNLTRDYILLYPVLALSLRSRQIDEMKVCWNNVIAFA